MSDSTRPLDTIQKWMQAVITHPAGVGGGVESDAAREQIAIDPDEIESVITRSQSLDSWGRLKVYADAYYARLLEVLSQEFVATARAVGEETFASFAFGYLQDYPSTSYTLGRLGAAFPEYLRQTRPDDVPEPGWPDFLIDLATLERTYADTFDGPGIEREELFSASDLERIPPERFGDARFVPAPCLTLLELRFPVHVYASAVRQEGEAEIPEPRTTYLAVTRRDFVVRRSPLSEFQFRLLSQLVAGRPLGEAIAAMVESAGRDEEQLLGTLHAWFQRWAQEQYFLRIEV